MTAPQLPNFWVINDQAWSILYYRSSAPWRRTSEEIWQCHEGSMSISRQNDAAPVFLARFAIGPSFEVDLHERHIRVFGGSLPEDTQTLKHLLFDQVVPRITSQMEGLVLHASACLVDGQLVSFLGKSGVGKSTLCAALDQAGCPLLGDDALAIDGVSLKGRAIYPSLRLNADSVAALFGETVKTRPMANYSRKLALRDTPQRPSKGNLEPIGALCCLEPCAQSKGLTTTRLDPSKACIKLMSESFALDTTDIAAARRRLAIASALANTIPCFTLSYPHDYECLPDIANEVAQALSSDALVPAR